MSDLISKSALMQKCSCRRNCNECDFFTDGDTWCDGEVFGTTIMQMPTVDAVEVVRCKDCYFFTPVVFDNPLAMKDVGKCAFLIGERQYTSCNGFCHLGERKEVSE